MTPAQIKQGCISRIQIGDEVLASRALVFEHWLPVIGGTFPVPSKFNSTRVIVGHDGIEDLMAYSHTLRTTDWGRPWTIKPARAYRYYIDLPLNWISFIRKQSIGT